MHFIKQRLFIIMSSLLCSPWLFAAEKSVFQSLDGVFGGINGLIAKVLFFDIFFFTDSVSVPFTVAWLLIGSIFFTVRMGFINIRGFKHAIDIVRGKYEGDEEEEKAVGEVTHFQALTAALSATVGLGNIAGVAIAIKIGGPGATFWMVLVGLLGMSSKFAECTLAQMYRKVRPDGHVMGGAMEYLSNGFKEIGWTRLGKVLAALFCVLCIGGSLGGGNAFQVKESLGAFADIFPFFKANSWVYGLIMVGLVGVVIIGGIKRIAHVAEAIVPLMCFVYVIACLYILFANFNLIPEAFGTIFASAFSFKAGAGGAAGTLIKSMVNGIKRAVFSNEAGIGSAAIAHSAAKTKYPVREGLVALLEPFIDTVVICTMTALVIVITGAYANPEFASLGGAALTSRAFGEEISWFPIILGLSVVLFAYSTMISWSYYGERCWSYLFGEKTNMLYRFIFLGAAFGGSVMSSQNILDFSDLMILGMAVPNILGLYFMSGKIKGSLDDYWNRYTSGAFDKKKLRKLKAQEST